MHTVVIVQDGYAPTQELGGVLCGALGARMWQFERRPDFAMYELVLIGLSPWGLSDPRLFAALASGELRDKHVAFFGAFPLPWAADWWLPAGRSALEAGGARLVPGPLWLAGDWLGRSRAIASDEARRWAEALARAFPAPAYPRRTPQS